MKTIEELATEAMTFSNIAEETGFWAAVEFIYGKEYADKAYNLFLSIIESE